MNPLDKLMHDLGLGQVIGQAKRVHGGLLHHMYRVNTHKSYAVKVLNPSIMKRPKAYGDYVFSEAFARYAQSKGIASLPALYINGQSIHESDGQYYLIFEWFDGLSGSDIEIDKKVCQKVGYTLSQIHNLNYQVPVEVEDYQDILWSDFKEKLNDFNYDWQKNFIENISFLEALNPKVMAALKALPNNVISHRDLDPKNSLWDVAMNMTIIDWESSGPVNDMVELLEVALDWTKDKDQFIALIKAYDDNRSIDKERLISSLYCMLYNKFNWLAYNLRRALYIECSNEEEALLGSKEVVSTLAAIKKYCEDMTTIEERMMEL